MTPIQTTMEIDSDHGALAYSYLRAGWFNEPAKRETLIYLRDAHGWVTRVMLLPAEQAAQMAGW